MTWELLLRSLLIVASPGDAALVKVTGRVIPAYAAFCRR